MASHTDLKVIQQMLGHSSIVTTADTYTNVLPETAHRAAQATATWSSRPPAAPRGPGSAGPSCPMSRPPSPPPSTAKCEFLQLKRLPCKDSRAIARVRDH
nr:hypothetical protein [Trebonia kvetii]